GHLRQRFEQLPFGVINIAEFFNQQFVEIIVFVFHKNSRFKIFWSPLRFQQRDSLAEDVPRFHVGWFGEKTGGTSREVFAEQLHLANSPCKWRCKSPRQENAVRSNPIRPSTTLSLQQ